MEQQHQNFDWNEEQTRREQAMQQEDGFNYDTFMRYLHDQEYRPAPHIEPDTRTGFDERGDYHAIPTDKTALRGLENAITPYRWASYLQDAVIQLCMGNDYHTGLAERRDMAEQILNERLERAGSEQEKASLYQAMQIWYRSYGR